MYIFVRSFVCLFVCSFVRLFVRLIVCSFVRLLVCLLAYFINFSLLQKISGLLHKIVLFSQLSIEPSYNFQDADENESIPPEDRIVNIVCPYASKPYAEQLKLKENQMKKCMERMTSNMRLV